jgi:hypothetical protein
MSKEATRSLNLRPVRYMLEQNIWFPYGATATRFLWEPTVCARLSDGRRRYRLFSCRPRGRERRLVLYGWRGHGLIRNVCPRPSRAPLFVMGRALRARFVAVFRVPCNAMARGRGSILGLVSGSSTVSCLGWPLWKVTTDK